MTGYQLRAFVLWARGGVVIQGGRLIEHLHFDGPAQADKILLEAAELGWIRRRNYEPTEARRFFVHNAWPQLEEEHRAPCDYAWEIMPSAPVWTDEADRAIERHPTSPEAERQLRELELEWVERTKRERETALVGMAHEVLAAVKHNLSAAPRTDIARTKRSSRGQ